MHRRGEVPADQDWVEDGDVELVVTVDGVEHTVGAGEAFEVAAGTPHRMWNPTEKSVRARWQTTPPGRTAEWFAELDGGLAILGGIARLRGYRPSQTGR